VQLYACMQSRFENYGDKMKWKVLFGAISIIITGSTAYADGDTYIVQFNSGIQLFDSGTGQSHESRNYVTATYDELQEYLDVGIVDYYEPDYEVKLLDTFTMYSGEDDQWNLDAIGISKPWGLGCYGSDVLVGVIDSGCYEHPDLAGNLIGGRNYTSTDIKNTQDNIGHGTFVSGIISAESNGEYITGVSHKARIVPLKCFDNGITTKTSMISVDIFGCEVINMSLGIPKSKITKTLENAIKYAIKNGCIIVAAVGNDGSTVEYYPAKYGNVIGVGSVNKGGIVSHFSQYNTTVDCVAPGESLQSVSIDGYSGNSGTSFAAPHISAMAAIAKCINKDISPGEFAEILTKTSRHPQDAEGKVDRLHFHKYTKQDISHLRQLNSFVPLRCF